MAQVGKGGESTRMDAPTPPDAGAPDGVTAPDGAVPAAASVAADRTSAPGRAGTPAAAAAPPETFNALPISVVIPAYNRSDLLPRALRAVAAQTHHPAEVIVVDDASADDTAAVAKSLGARVVLHPENRGAAAARNTGIAEATGEWVALLDSDDEWRPDHLASLWASRADHVLVSASALATGSPPQVIGAPRGRPVVIDSPAALIYPGNSIVATGAMVRRDVALAAGGFDTELRYAEDFDLWLRVLEGGTAVVSPAVTCIYRRHGGQKSTTAGAPKETQARIARAYADRPWWSDALADKREAVRAYDELGTTFRSGARADAIRRAAWIAARPRRATAVGQTLAERRRRRVAASRLPWSA
jgi:GT2 family glycosyltransferase